MRKLQNSIWGQIDSKFQQESQGGPSSLESINPCQLDWIFRVFSRECFANLECRINGHFFVLEFMKAHVANAPKDPQHLTIAVKGQSRAGSVIHKRGGF